MTVTRSLPLIGYGNHEPRNAYRSNPGERLSSENHERKTNDQNDQHKAEHDGSVTDG